MTNQELTKFFETHEWYDNSRIKMIRGCKRKAFYQLIGPRGQGLEAKVGDGANFGSSFHAGLARYYSGWGKFDESTRRAHASRAFAEEWGKYFPHEHIQTKHKLDRGLTILDAYFDQYLHEDSLFEPIESELGFCVEIHPARPEENIPFGFDPLFRPFWYVGRIDGIFKRISTGDLYIRETKTTSKQAEERLQHLKIDHQAIGYTACARLLNNEVAQKITGFMGDVVLVAVNKLEFCRNYFHVTNAQASSWRQQLINTVVDWRKLLDGNVALNSSEDGHWVNLDGFYQDTERCFEYGKCAFYDLCDFGINDEALAEFSPSSWHPLIKNTPKRIEIVHEIDIKELRIEH